MAHQGMSCSWPNSCAGNDLVAVSQLQVMSVNAGRRYSDLVSPNRWVRVGVTSQQG